MCKDVFVICFVIRFRLKARDAVVNCRLLFFLSVSAIFFCRLLDSTFLFAKIFHGSLILNHQKLVIFLGTWNIYFSLANNRKKIKKIKLTLSVMTYYLLFFYLLFAIATSIYFAIKKASIPSSNVCSVAQRSKQPAWILAKGHIAAVQTAQPRKGAAKFFWWVLHASDALKWRIVYV